MILASGGCESPEFDVVVRILGGFTSPARQSRPWNWREVSGGVPGTRVAVMREVVIVEEPMAGRRCCRWQNRFSNKPSQAD